MSTKSPPPQMLSLVVVTDGSSDDSEIREASPWTAIKSLFVGKKEVPLERVQSELARVQAEVDGLLAMIDTSETHKGFRLAEVTVSLAISGEGSIGVVTAGVEAGISLTFARTE